MRGASGRRSTVDGVLFDLDDTLIDWWSSMDDCLADLVDHETADALFAHCRAHFWERHPEHGHVWHRNTWALHHRRQDAWPRALPHLDPDDLDLLMRRFDESLWVRFYDDTVPTLDTLVERHTGSLALGVLSNNGLLSIEVERLRLNDWFEVCVSAPVDRRKPDPRAFEHGCQALGTEPSRTVYVGDSIKADALGALGAGLIPVWVDRWGDEWPDKPAAVHRVSSLAELPALLAGLS